MNGEEKISKEGEENGSAVVIDDIYPSIQGEGFYIGEKSLIVKVKGCNLDCEPCDSKDISTGHVKNVDELCYEIVEKCHEIGTDVIVITGGEAFYQKNGIMELIQMIPQRMKITIETHGGVPIPEELFDNNSIFLSISPKLSKEYSTKEFDANTLKINKNNFWNYQIKFTIDDIEDDIEEAVALLRRSMVPEFPSIIFQPLIEEDDTVEDILEKERELTNYLVNNGELSKFDIRILPKLQKLLYREENEK